MAFPLLLAFLLLQKCLFVVVVPAVANFLFYCCPYTIVSVPPNAGISSVDGFLTIAGFLAVAGVPDASGGSCFWWGSPAALLLLTAYC